MIRYSLFLSLLAVHLSNSQALTTGSANDLKEQISSLSLNEVTPEMVAELTQGLQQLFINPDRKPVTPEAVKELAELLEQLHIKKTALPSNKRESQKADTIPPTRWTSLKIPVPLKAMLACFLSFSYQAGDELKKLSKWLWFKTVPTIWTKKEEKKITFGGE